MKLILALALGATAQFATPALRGGARRLEALELLGAEESAKVEAEQEAARATALAEAMAQLKEAQDMMAKAEALKAALADRPASAAEAQAAGKPGCAPGTCDSDTSKLMGFSSTCYYFGESLSDELAKGGAPPPPIGLVHTAWGGSTIEQWLTNETIASCKNASISGSNQEWHDQRVMPYIGMTVKGWVWCESSLSATAGRSPFS